MRSFTVAERRARLARRHFLGPQSTDVTTVTAGLVGLHATDPATPYLSLWARIPGFDRADLDAVLYRDRTMLKHLAMRRTLWAICTDSLPAVQAAASDRVAANESRKLIADVEKAGVAADGAAWLQTACTAVLAYLEANGPTSAAQLRTALPELAGTWDPAPGKPWGGATPLSPRVITVLAVRGAVVRGPNQGGWTSSRPLWVSADSWLDGAASSGPSAPDASGTELVRTWLRAFGPATVADVKWWFGHTLTWTRRALADIGAVEVDLHGTPGVALPDDLEPEPDAGPWCALLPGLDLSTMGWVDRDWYLDGLGDRVFDTRGNAGPTAWVNGRVVGAWRQSDDGRVLPQIVAEVDRGARQELQRKADALTEWLDGTVVKPRFPSPLSKSRGQPDEASIR